MLKRLFAVMLLVGVAQAGTIAGSLQTPTAGAVKNGTLTFDLSQATIVSGTASIVPSTSACYTSTAGAVVGIPDPIILPVLATNTGYGSLAAGTYYVKLTYTGAGGESYPSSESAINLVSQGTVIVSAPALQPASATGYKVYISSAAGTETLQGTVTGWTNYSQSTALASGAALPSSNSSVCTIYFSDQMIPTGTYYSVNLKNKNGTQMAGYPQTWCTYGGAAGTINVSGGAPTGNCGTAGVYYPTPIWSMPALNALQSISGPLSLGTYPLSLGGMTLTNAGQFDNLGSYQYAKAQIHGCNTQSLYSTVNGGYDTAAIAACIEVPAGSTERQVDTAAFMVDDKSAGGSPTVALFAAGYADSNNANTFGANIKCQMNVAKTGTTCTAMELDADANVNGNGVALAITGDWPSQPTASTAIDIALNNTHGSFHWPRGIHFGVNATPAVGNGVGAILLEPIAATANQESQGLFFLANQAVTGQLAEKLRALPNGALDVAAPGGGGTFSIEGGTPLATTNQTGTGSIVLATSPTLVTPTLGVATATSYKLAGILLLSSTAPTISSGFGTTPSVANNNGAAAFTINVGTGGTATNGVIGLPTAATGWNCFVNNITAAAAHRADNTRQTASSASSVTIENQTTSSGAALAWTASDIIRVSCFAY